MPLLSEACCFEKKKCYSYEKCHAESVMYKTLFIKHSKLSAGSNKTSDLLGTLI